MSDSKSQQEEVVPVSKMNTLLAVFFGVFIGGIAAMAVFSIYIEKPLRSELYAFKTQVKQTEMEKQALDKTLEEQSRIQESSSDEASALVVEESAAEETPADEGVVEASVVDEERIKEVIEDEIVADLSVKSVTDDLQCNCPLQQAQPESAQVSAVEAVESPDPMAAPTNRPGQEASIEQVMVWLSR